jgi:hypothetical protein
MTKGRAALTSAAVTEGWTQRPQVFAIFIPLVGSQAHDNSSKDISKKGSWVGK